MKNIPIYRAKKIDSNEDVEGYYFRDENFIHTREHRMQVTKRNPNIPKGTYGSYKHEYCAIDITTLAIHFPDIIDSQGNKIFASLSEDGKGGDIVQYEDVEGIVYFDCFGFQIRTNTNQGFLSAHNFSKAQVIGIQK